jgi:hypothetical protein
MNNLHLFCWNIRTRSIQVACCAMRIEWNVRSFLLLGAKKTPVIFKDVDNRNNSKRASWDFYNMIKERYQQNDGAVNRIIYIYIM